MSSRNLFLLSGVVAALAVALFAYSSWLRVIQTGSEAAEYWTPILWAAALILLIAGFVRRR